MIFTVKWCFVSSGLETPLQGCGWKNVSVIKRFWQNVEWTGGNLKVSELYTVITECQICMLKYYVFITFCSALFNKKYWWIFQNCLGLFLWNTSSIQVYWDITWWISLYEFWINGIQIFSFEFEKKFTHCSNGSYCFIVIAGFILVVTATLRRVYCYRMEWTGRTSSDLVLNQATMLSLSGKSIDLNHRILTKSYSLFCSDKF